MHGVVHLAAQEGPLRESVRSHSCYYRENVEGLRVLLEAVTATGVESFVFSSSAAVYGDTGRRRVSSRTHRGAPGHPVRAHEADR